MEPITQSFNSSKKEIMDTFPAVFQELDMILHGSSDRLGLVSIKKSNQPMLYAHIIEHADNTATVAIAPGKTFLKDRSQSERPDAVIQQLQNKLKAILSNNR